MLVLSVCFGCIGCIGFRSMVLQGFPILGAHSMRTIVNQTGTNTEHEMEATFLLNHITLNVFVHKPAGPGIEPNVSLSLL